METGLDALAEETDTEVVDFVSLSERKAGPRGSLFRLRHDRLPLVTGGRNIAWVSQC